MMAQPSPPENKMEWVAKDKAQGNKTLVFWFKCVCPEAPELSSQHKITHEGAQDNR